MPTRDVSAQHLVYRGLVVRNAVRVKRGGGKAGIATNVLHLPRFAPAVRLEAWQRLSVRAAVTLFSAETARLTCTMDAAVLKRIAITALLRTKYWNTITQRTSSYQYGAKAPSNGRAPPP